MSSRLWWIGPKGIKNVREQNARRVAKIAALEAEVCDLVEQCIMLEQERDQLIHTLRHPM